MARRNNIVLVRRDTPKKVTLPNGRTFNANIRGAKHVDLPANITFARKTPQRKKAAVNRKLPDLLARICRHRKNRIGKKRLHLLIQ